MLIYHEIIRYKIIGLITTLVTLMTMVTLMTLIEVFITAESGITLLSYVVSKSVSQRDSTLIASFFSAISGMAQALSGGQIQELTLSNVKFLFGKGSKVLCIFVLSEHSSSEKYRKIQSKLINDFEGSFDLSDWGGNVKMFEPFREVLNKFLYEEIEAAKIAAVAGQWRQTLDHASN